MKGYGENRDQLEQAANAVPEAISDPRDMANPQFASFAENFPYINPHPYPIPLPNLTGLYFGGWIVETFDEEMHLSEIIVETGAAPEGTRAMMVSLKAADSDAWCYENQWLSTEVVSSWNAIFYELVTKWEEHLNGLIHWLLVISPEPSVDNSDVVAQIQELQRALAELADEWAKVRKWRSRGGRS